MKSTIALTATLATALSAAAIGYAIWFDRKRRTDPEFRKRFQTSPASSDSKQEPEDKKSHSPAPPAEASPTPREIDLPLEQIFAQPIETRQKIFQSLLVYGETFLALGTPIANAKGIEYLYKAVNMVPNPSELLALFKQNLPSAIFEAIVEKINAETKQRISDYYASLIETNEKGSAALVHWKYDSSLAREIPKYLAYRLHSLKEAEAGDLLFAEELDQFFVSASALAAEKKVCGFCSIALDDSSAEYCVCNGDCGSAYCSQVCMQHAQDNYHRFFCSKQEEIDSLGVFGVFVGKYIAMMLSEELKGNSAHRKGPFMHYEFLAKVPIQREQTAQASNEAAIVRSVLSPVNAGMEEFLTDERYLTMHATLRHNAFATSNDKSEPKLRWCNRSSSSSNESIVCLLTTLVHIEHSCTPNAEIVLDLAARKANLVAIRSIAKDECITVSWLSPQDLASEDKHSMLMNSFFLLCNCAECANKKKSG